MSVSSTKKKKEKEVKDEEKSRVGGEKEKKRSHPTLQELKKKGREAMKSVTAKSSDDVTQSTPKPEKTFSDCPPPSAVGTGLVYDPVFLKHTIPYECEPGKSENPQRISVCYEALKKEKLVDQCIEIPSRMATDEELLYLHSAEHIDIMKKTADMSVDELKTLSDNYDSIAFSKDSFECGSFAAGSAITLVEHILSGKIRNGIALTRPPGHHAQCDIACGYSYFNNVALAAYHARHHCNANRVLIVDWDIHHGQGTQYLFEEDPSVLYISIHRYEHGSFWPHLSDSDYQCVGKGKGRGFTINIPWNKTGMGDSEYIAAFHQIVLPVAYQFDPDVVLVSAGFDSGLGDPKGEMNLSSDGFAVMTTMLMSLAQGKLAVVMEGGYNFDTVSEGVSMVTRTLLGEPCPALQTTKPCDSAIQSILDVLSVHSNYWRCFQYQELDEDSDGQTVGVEISSDTLQEQQQPEDDIVSDVLSKFTVMRLNCPPHRTAITYDERMGAHYDQWYKSHPECPNRITAMYKKHEDWGLLDRCIEVQSRMATDDEILLLHSSDHLKLMKKSQGMKNRQLIELASNFNSIYFHESSYKCACLAAGSVLNVVQEVVTGKVRNGVCIVRPPGHHAEQDKPCGFCFFNNVALAAKYAQNNFGLKRILIIDWDIHHGNGIQHMFENDDTVLYISLHRYDNGYFYPSSSDANYDRIGIDKGKGYNVNIAWNGARMGDAEYIAAFQQIVMPIAMEFCPELVLVSSGFDAAKGDPLGGYHITPEGYSHLTHMLCTLANGKVILVLEGGYNLNSISVSMAMCTKTLLGDSCPVIGEIIPCDSAVDSILSTLHAHNIYWQSLQFQVTLPETDLQMEGGDTGIKQESGISDSPAAGAGGDAGNIVMEFGGDVDDSLREVSRNTGDNLRESSGDNLQTTAGSGLAKSNDATGENLESPNKEQLVGLMQTQEHETKYPETSQDPSLNISTDSGVSECQGHPVSHLDTEHEIMISGMKDVKISENIDDTIGTTQSENKLKEVVTCLD